jgi:hypothetical protein
MTVGKVSNQTSMPVLATGVPFVETIDLNSPMEWLWWGGLAADILFVSGVSKWIIAAGILAARYEVGKEKRWIQDGL